MINCCTSYYRKFSYRALTATTGENRYKLYPCQFWFMLFFVLSCMIIYWLGGLNWCKLFIRLQSDCLWCNSAKGAFIIWVSKHGNCVIARANVELCSTVQDSHAPNENVIIGEVNVISAGHHTHQCCLCPASILQYYC